MIDKLNDSTRIMTQKISLLLKVTPWVTEERVSAYLKESKFNFTELFEEAFRIGTLTDKQYLGVIFMTLIIGEEWVEKLPLMLANYKEKEHLVCTLEPALTHTGMLKKSA